MRPLHFQDARKPIFSSEDGSTIDLEVKWKEFEEYLPFTANPEDGWPQGPYLFNRAKRGDFGKVKPFTPTQED